MSSPAVCLQDPRDSQSPLSVPATLPETVSWSQVPHTTVPRSLPTDHFDFMLCLLNPPARPASARTTCPHSTEDADTRRVLQVVDPEEEVRLTTTLHYRPQSRHQTTHCSSSSCLQLQLSLVRGPGRCSLYRAQEEEDSHCSLHYAELWLTADIHCRLLAPDWLGCLRSKSGSAARGHYLLQPSWRGH